MIEKLRWPEKVENIRNIWPGEATHFTPWLSDSRNLRELGSIIGYGSIELIDTEVSCFGSKRLDILAKDSFGTKIAIENMYDKVDDSHVSRLLMYASAHEARVRVLVAENFEDKFVTVLQDLNNDSINNQYYGVQISVEKIDEWFIPRLNVIVAPNELVKDSRIKTTFKENEKKKDYGRYAISIDGSVINPSSSKANIPKAVVVHLYENNYLDEQALKEMTRSGYDSAPLIVTKSTATENRKFRNRYGITKSFNWDRDEWVVRGQVGIDNIDHVVSYLSSVSSANVSIERAASIIR